MREEGLGRKLALAKQAAPLAGVALVLGDGALDEVLWLETGRY